MKESVALKWIPVCRRVLAVPHTSRDIFLPKLLHTNVWAMEMGLRSQGVLDYHYLGNQDKTDHIAPIISQTEITVV